jgi:hypothetical protein
MPHAVLQTSEDIISGILNWVCPEWGRMGGRTKELKCEGPCRKDWRDVRESRLAKSGRTRIRGHGLAAGRALVPGPS